MLYSILHTIYIGSTIPQGKLFWHLPKKALLPDDIKNRKENDFVAL